MWVRTVRSLCFSNALHPSHLEPIGSDKAGKRSLGPNTPEWRGPPQIQSCALPVAYRACWRISANLASGEQREGEFEQNLLSGTPRRASDSPGLGSWIKSPWYKKDVIPVPHTVSFPLPSLPQRSPHCKMRHRATSVPYYKGSMSAPPILTTRDLSGKYILVSFST